MSQKKKNRKSIVENVMNKVYYNPEHVLGYTGNTQQLLKKIPNEEAAIMTWLESQPAYTLHKPVRRRFQTRVYRTTFPDRQWQADLVDMQKFKAVNDGNGYILTAIDIFTRYAWAVPINTKHYDNVIRGFKTIFNNTKMRKPHLLQTDQGREFENQHIQNFFRSHGIKQFSVKSPYKAALVERFHRTLRGRMYRYFTKSGTHRWVDVLPSLVTAYNSSPHSSLYGATPASISDQNAMKLWEKRNIHTSTSQQRIKFRIGDLVRLALVKEAFSRGYTPNWTEEVFQVSGIDSRQQPIMYRVRELQSNGLPGEEIEGKFYAQELQHVQNVYRIEQILKSRVHPSNSNEIQYYVKWMGYDQPSWIGAHQLIT